MSKIFQITKYAVRREDGSVKELPYGCYAYEFYSKCNYTIIGFKNKRTQGVIDRNGNIIIPVEFPETLETLLFNYEIIFKVINKRYVIAKKEANFDKYDILDLNKMKVLYSGLSSVTEVIKKLEKCDDNTP